MFIGVVVQRERPSAARSALFGTPPPDRRRLTRTLTMADRHRTDVVDRLKAHIPDLPTLLALVSGFLDSIGLLPPQYAQYNTAPLPVPVNVSRHLPSIQRALLENVIPTWEPALSKEKLMSLVEQCFIPDAFSYAKPVAGEVAAHAYASILSLPFTSYTMTLLAHLTKSYPIDRLHSCVFPQRDAHTSSTRSIFEWEDVVKNLLSVPARVANALEGKGDCPNELEQGPYFSHLSLRFEALLWKLSQEQADGVPCICRRKSTADALQKACHL